MVTGGNASRDVSRKLAQFTTGGYGGGRSLGWKAAWFAVQNLIFDRWWLPRRLRPALLRLFGAKVGSGCVIRHGVRIHWPWNLELGDDVWIGEAAWLQSLVDIVVEDNVCISQRASIVTGSHDHRDPYFSYDNGPIVLRSGCWIATGAIVLRGVSIGRNAVVSAGAVVSGDVPDNTMVSCSVLRSRSTA
jgi:putative colanic acid biosynthesis acetyltransferase WcaF